MGSKQNDRSNSSKNVPKKAVKRTRFYDRYFLFIWSKCFSKNNRPKPQKSARSSNKDPFEGITFSEKDLLKELPKGTFSGDSRIFVGNLPREVSKDQVKDLFTPFGGVSEVYVSDKGFSFVKMVNVLFNLFIFNDRIIDPTRTLQYLHLTEISLNNSIAAWMLKKPHLIQLLNWKNCRVAFLTKCCTTLSLYLVKLKGL